MTNSAARRNNTSLLLILSATIGLLGQDGNVAPKIDYASALKQLQEQAALEPCDEAKVQEAMAAMLVADPTLAARDAIAQMANAKDLVAYYAIATALGEAWSKEAIDVIAANIRKHPSEDVRRELVISLMSNDYLPANSAVLDLLKDASLPDDVRTMLVEDSAKRKLRDAIHVLIEIYGKEEPKAAQPSELAWACRNALATLTGFRLENSTKYSEWWKANSSTAQVAEQKALDKGVIPPLTGSTIVQYEAVKAAIKKEDIVVVPGPETGEKVEWVVRALQVPHTLTDWSKPKESEFKNGKVFIIGSDGMGPIRFYCNYKNPTIINEKSQKMLDLLKERVQAGAYLLTTDSCIGNVIRPMVGDVFEIVEQKQRHELIERARKEGWRGVDDKYRIFPPRGQMVRQLMKDWWLRAELHYGREPKGQGYANTLQAIRGKSITENWVPGDHWFKLKENKFGIEVISNSPELSRTYGYPILGIMLRFGKGKLLHLSGALVNQSRGRNCELDKLIANFVLEGCERCLSPGK